MDSLSDINGLQSGASAPHTDGMVPASAATAGDSTNFHKPVVIGTWNDAPKPTPEPVVQPSSMASVPPPAAPLARPAASPPPMPVRAPMPPHSAMVSPAPMPAPAPNSRLGMKTILFTAIAAIVVMAIGGGLLFFLKAKSKAPSTATNSITITPIAPSGLAQSVDGQTQLAAGGTSNKAVINLGFTVVTTANSGQITPEIEVQPIGVAFTNQPTLSGPPLTAHGSTLLASVVVSSLKNGSYHWQARTTVGTQGSDWISFGSNDKSVADFVVNLGTAATPVVPASPTVSTVDGKPVANGSATTTSTSPVITGTAPAKAKISLVAATDSITVTATADDKGAWSATPSTPIAAGSHSFAITATDASGIVSAVTSLNLIVSPAPVAAATAPTTTTTATPPPPPAVTPPPPPAVTPPPAPVAAATAPAVLAATGDLPTTLNLISLAGLIMAALGWVTVRRYVRD